MKSLRALLICTLFSLSIALMYSCNNKENASEQSEQSEKSGKEYSSAYICPMHCEGSGSDIEGKCPVCGMDYVKNETHNATEHDHDNHEGHDHDSHEGHNH